MEVYFDGGIRCGNDVFKAIALGARAVFIGPALWGLACNGEAGVAEVLHMLKNEMKTSMQLMISRSWNEIKIQNMLFLDRFTIVSCEIKFEFDTQPTLCTVAYCACASKRCLLCLALP